MKDAPTEAFESAIDGSISATSLSQMTGLTDRRHRQLARDGYFPEPVESQYQMGPTIQGLLRYYREHNQRTKEKIIGTKDTKTQLEIKILRARFEREQGDVIPRDAVNRMVARAGSLIRSRLYAALERDYPGRVQGRSPSEIAAIGRALADELIDFLRTCDQRPANEPKPPYAPHEPRR
jgi:hypothetical protein